MFCFPNSDHVMFSRKFINYVCTWIRRNLKETVFWNTITWFERGKETYKLKRSIAVRRETAQLLLIQIVSSVMPIIILIRLRTRKCDVKPANSTTARFRWEQNGHEKAFTSSYRRSSLFHERVIQRLSQENWKNAT